MPSSVLQTGLAIISSLYPDVIVLMYTYDIHDTPGRIIAETITHNRWLLIIDFCACVQYMESPFIWHLRKHIYVLYASHI